MNKPTKKFLSCAYIRFHRQVQALRAGEIWLVKRLAHQAKQENQARLDRQIRLHLSY